VPEASWILWQSLATKFVPIQSTARSRHCENTSGTSTPRRGLEPRPPFHRKVELHYGVAGDIQAFGYKDSRLSPMPAMLPDSASPWYDFRQDLYLEADSAPFLIIHWKHALSAIRVLDIIPAGETSLVSR